MTRLHQVIFILLLGLILLFQYQLWWGQNSVPAWLKVRSLDQSQVINNQAQQQRNDALYRQIKALRHSDSTVEVIARRDLGMIKKGEIFYQFKGIKQDQS